MSQKRVLITDKLSEQGLAVFENREGIVADHKPGLSADEICKVLGEYDGLVIRSGTKVTQQIVDAGGRLRVVGRAGVGVDNVDLDAATRRGIVVMNTPGGNTTTTGEHTIALLLSMARNIPAAQASLKAGQWERSKYTGVEVFEKTLGVVGMGNIGKVVAERALGLRMRVVAFDPFLTADAASRLGVELVELDELFARADFVTVHTPVTPETRGLLGKASFAKMKDGVRIVNCARGGIVDEAALVEALQSGKVAGAALDVYQEEPPAPDNPLFAMEQVVCTPHLGASTDEAQVNVAIAIAEQVADYLLEGEIRNAVNSPSVSAERLPVLGPYLSLGEKLGALVAQIATGGFEEVDIEAAGEVTERDLKAVTASVLKGLLDVVSEEPVNPINAPHIAKERGLKILEALSSQTSDFVNSLTLRVRKDGVETRVMGAVFGKGILRIVRIDDVYMEASPEGHILVLHNRDVPGVVGSVGTLLADAEINIANFELGRDADGTAISLVHVDSEVPEAVIAKIRELPAVTGAQRVQL